MDICGRKRQRDDEKRREVVRRARNEGDTVDIMLRAAGAVLVLLAETIAGDAMQGNVGRFLLLVFVKTGGFKIAFISGPKSLPDHSERRVGTQGRGRKAGKDSKRYTGADAISLLANFLTSSRYPTWTVWLIAGAV